MILFQNLQCKRYIRIYNTFQTVQDFIYYIWTVCWINSHVVSRIVREAGFNFNFDGSSGGFSIVKVAAVN